MRALLAILILLTTLPCDGQVRRRALGRKPSSTPVDPSGINGLYAWWVSSDMTLTQRAGNTNPWIDRIQSIYLQNSDLSRYASNGSSGMSFAVATDLAYLTNAPLQAGTNSVVTFVFFATNHGDTVMTYLYGAYSQGDTPQGTNRGCFTWDNVDQKMYWGSRFKGAPAISSTIVTNTWYDVTYQLSNGVHYFFTNGTLSVRSTDAYLPLSVGWPWRGVGGEFLGATMRNLAGYVPEILVWSNQFTLGSLNVSNVHCYLTNKYGYKP